MEDKTARKIRYETRLARQKAVAIALAKRYPLCIDGDPARPLTSELPCGTRLEPEFLQRPKSKAHVAP